jgi:hypothetical protein
MEQQFLLGLNPLQALFNAHDVAEIVKSKVDSGLTCGWEAAGGTRAGGQAYNLPLSVDTRATELDTGR